MFHCVYTREQHAEMERKLRDLSSKVIVGGVNLLERAEAQQRLLEQSAQELEKRKKKEAKLTKKLHRSVFYEFTEKQKLVYSGFTDKQKFVYSEFTEKQKLVY